VHEGMPRGASVPCARAAGAQPSLPQPRDAKRMPLPRTGGCQKEQRGR